MSQDAISQAEKVDKINNVGVPGILETKAIAEEGLIYGLPLVMYYTSTYELFVDPTSSQYKAPIGTLTNEARVFTYEDTAVITPNSDTPYSLMEIDLRAEPAVISVPAVPKPRYYSVQLTDANTFNYGYIGSRTTGDEPGDFMVVGPDWKGEVPSQIKQVFHSTTPFSAVILRTQLFNAADMPNVVKIQAGYKVQPLSAFSQAACSSRSTRHQLPQNQCRDCQERVLGDTRFCLAVLPGRPGGGGDPHQAGQHWDRCRQTV